MNIEKGPRIREGKAKILFETNPPQGHLIQWFKDDATGFNGLKKGTIKDKGVVNNTISTLMFQYLEKSGIPTHFAQKLSDREMLIKKVKIIPVEVVVRNFAAGSLCKRLGTEKGRKLSPPLVEYFYKSDELNDPLLSENHIFYFDWATKQELAQMTETALKVNDCMREAFDSMGLSLVDYKLEFGRDTEGNLLLADEITPDGCRLWDKDTGESMDKDRFRHDLGKVDETYQEVCRRVKEHFEARL